MIDKKKELLAKKGELEKSIKKSEIVSMIGCVTSGLLYMLRFACRAGLITGIVPSTLGLGAPFFLVLGSLGGLRVLSIRDKLNGIVENLQCIEYGEGNAEYYRSQKGEEFVPHVDLDPGIPKSQNPEIPKSNDLNDLIK